MMDIAIGIIPTPKNKRGEGQGQNVKKGVWYLRISNDQRKGIIKEETESDEERKGRMKRMDRSCCAVNHSGKNPFAASFDEFIKHHANIIQSKPANVKSKELCGMSRTQFQTNKSWRGMFEARIFYLLGNLI